VPEEPKQAPRVSFWTLGCRLNQHDTASLRALALDAGFEETPDGRADVIVVNTCTVTARADQEARQLVRRLVREAPGARVVVTGCYAQRAPEEIRAIPGVSAVLGTAERDDGDTFARALLGDAGSLPVRFGRAIRVFRTSAPILVGRSRALLKVQDGCDSFCTYCIVPYVRGRSRSLPHDEALERARRLLEAGHHEIVLTGADLGSYGRDLPARSGSHPLTRLVRAILALGEHHRVRLSSIEPHKVDPELGDAIGYEPRLCRHLHLPLQSGSDPVLRAMRRGYERAEYRALVERLAARGTIAVGADVIVGFPGEGPKEFEETRRFLEDLPLAYLHVFRYSPRPGTASVRLGPAARGEVSRERSEVLRALGAVKAEHFRRSLLGVILPVVAESGSGARGPLAMSDVYVPVQLEPTPRGRFGLGDARIHAVEGTALVGALERG